jgi:hypothetical protein
MRALTGRTHTLPPAWPYKPREELDHRGDEPFAATFEMDVYAFGSVTYQVRNFSLSECNVISSSWQILCGRPPYHGRNIYRSIHDIIDRGHIVLPKPPQINAQMWRVIQKCWARDPEDLPTMAQVVDELEQFIHI